MGETAKDLTEDEAARIASRLERASRRGVFQPTQTDGKGRAIPRRVAEGPARNEPCPCKSGAKYKKCCGAIAAGGPNIQAMPLSGFLPGINHTPGPQPVGSVRELENEVEKLQEEGAKVELVEFADIASGFREVMPGSPDGPTAAFGGPAMLIKDEDAK